MIIGNDRVYHLIKVEIDALKMQNNPVMFYGNIERYYDLTVFIVD